MHVCAVCKASSMQSYVCMLVQQQEGGLVQPIGYTSSLKKHKKQYGANEFKGFHPLSTYIAMFNTPQPSGKLALPDDVW